MPTSVQSDPAAKQAALGVLGDWALQSLIFSHAGFVVSPSLFQDVADAISADRIKVMVDPTGHWGGEYQVKQDCMLVQRVPFVDLTDDVGVVHEAVHAGMDLRKYFAIGAVSEAIAYVGGCYFLCLRAPSFTLSGNVNAKAMWIARKLAQGSPVSQDDWSELYAALASSPDYGPLAVIGVVGYNGVP